jgi:hypothetical protein
MRPTRFIPSLIAAYMATVTACSDSTGPTRLPPPGPSTPTVVTLSGVIRHNGTPLNSGVVLATGDGAEIVLTGPETFLLAQVENAEVEMRGTWGIESSFAVQDFVVQRVDGAAAMDGVLVEIFAHDLVLGTEPLGYGLALTSGSIFPLIDPPTELREFLGERVWVIALPDAPPTVFGVIRNQ